MNVKSSHFARHQIAADRQSQCVAHVPPRNSRYFCTQNVGPLSSVRNLAPLPLTTYVTARPTHQMQNNVSTGPQRLLRFTRALDSRRTNGQPPLRWTPFSPKGEVPGVFSGTTTACGLAPSAPQITAETSTPLVSCLERRYSTHAFTTHLHSPPFIRRGWGGEPSHVTRLLANTQPLLKRSRYVILSKAKNLRRPGGDPSVAKAPSR